MPKKRLAEFITARFYKWRIKRRGRVFVADGRSNTPSLGRHSLDTDDYEAAVDALTKLDLLCAIKQGKASPHEVSNEPKTLTLEEGRQRYEKFVARPAILQGAKPTTIKRYKPVFDKFLAFAVTEEIRYWNVVYRIRTVASTMSVPVSSQQAKGNHNLLLANGRSRGHRRALQSRSATSLVASCRHGACLHGITHLRTRVITVDRYRLRREPNPHHRRNGPGSQEVQQAGATNEDGSQPRVPNVPSPADDPRNHTTSSEWLGLSRSARRHTEAGYSSTDSDSRRTHAIVKAISNWSR